MKKCTHGKRHTWSFLRNVTEKRIYSSGSIQLSLRGLYKCRCGEQKLGMAHLNFGGVRDGQG